MFTKTFCGVGKNLCWHRALTSNTLPAIIASERKMATDKQTNRKESLIPSLDRIGSNGFNGHHKGIPNHVATLIREIRISKHLPQAELARVLNTSLVSVDRWERGVSAPSPEQTAAIQSLYEGLDGWSENGHSSPFASKGVRDQQVEEDVEPRTDTILNQRPGASVLERMELKLAGVDTTKNAVRALSDLHRTAAVTANRPPDTGMSAGKNTYTYDAHTYHTKVPPQGIAELLKHYLPHGGLVLDPFAGSGMTGVAAQVVGCDCVLNELSPAAAFIADRFTSSISPALFRAGVNAVLSDSRKLREGLYTTKCRECDKETELLYTVWSYRLMCPHCEHPFTLWDHCRQYGLRVRDHKLLSEFPCPNCKSVLKKARLKRLAIVPVQVGYKCCGSRQTEVTHPPNRVDLRLISSIAKEPPLCTGFYPTVKFLTA
jgi:DNA-binding transcriptional regulator YiaG